MGHGFIPILQMRNTEAVGLKANFSGGQPLNLYESHRWVGAIPIL